MSLNVVVCIRHFPQPGRHFELSTEYYKGTIQKRNGVNQIICPADQGALEAALRLKTDFNCSVIAIAIGPFAAMENLTEALSMGVDRAVLLCDDFFNQAGNGEISCFLAAGIKMAVPEYNLVICGAGLIDGMSDGIGVKLAGCLGIGHVSGLPGLKVSSTCIEIKVETGGAAERLYPPLPFVLTVPGEAAGEAPYRTDNISDKEIYIINAVNLGMKSY